MVLITLEGVIGLAISTVIAFFTIAYMIEEEHLEIPDEESSETKESDATIEWNEKYRPKYDYDDLS